MRIYEVENYEELSKKCANIIVAQMLLNPKCVLGLATGSTPIGTYQILREKFELGEIDFKNIKTINLDEYIGLDKNNPQSYDYFMRENLFNYVNIKENNINIPNGTAENLEEECKRYDNLIDEIGPIDIQILGIGNNGHIGFNEPDTKFTHKTHVVDLKKSTIEANKRFFNSIKEVPKKAITVGVDSIMNAKCVILLVNTKEKVEILNKALNGEVTPNIPVSILKKHNNLIIIKIKA